MIDNSSATFSLTGLQKIASPVQAEKIVTVVDKAAEFYIARHPSAARDFLWSQIENDFLQSAFAELSVNERAIIVWQLHDLLPFPSSLASESDDEINPLTAAIASMVGAILAANSGYLYGNYFLNEPFTAAIIGSGIGGFFTAWASVYVAQNQSLRQNIFRVLGVTAAIDISWQIFKTALPKLLPWRTKSDSGFFNRGLIYLAIGFWLKCLTRKKTSENVTAILKTCLRTWFDAALRSSIVLAEQMTEQKKNISTDVYDDKKFILSLAQVLAKPAAADSLLTEIRQEFYQRGFAFSDTENLLAQKIIWDATTQREFEPLEILRTGDEIVIEKEPLYRDGKIIEKGCARKLRR